jgi:hypothetical protein
MSTIGNDVQDGSLDTAAKAFLKSWEDGESPSKKDEEEDAQTETSDETDDASADTESEDTASEDEGSDEDPNADAEGEEDQDEGEDKKPSKSASDEMEVILNVDGEEHRVSVRDLKRLYGQEASLTRKSQAVAAAQKQYEETTTKYVTGLQSMTQKAMEKWKPYSEVDWAVAQSQLSANDFAALRQQAKSAYDEAKFLAEELDGTMKDAQQKYNSSLRERAQDTIKTLTDPSSPHHIPKWSNEVYDDIRTFATSMGMAQQVVDTLVDPAALKIIHLAMLQSKSKDIVTKKVAQSPKKVLTSKKSPSQGSTSKTKATTAFNKARKSGTLDDAAAAFLAKWS